MKLGDVFPNFTVDSSHGEINFYEFIEGSWCILFSHPADFTPVCTTELAAVANLADEFGKRGVRLIALSCDSADSHRGWIEDLKAYANLKSDACWPFPIIADKDRKLAVELGMLDPDERNAEGLPVTARCVFVIGPDKKLKSLILYPATSGRSFDEILRLVDSLQLTSNKPVATPVNWKPGDDCMVIPTIKAEDIPALFPKGVKCVSVPSEKSYIRITPQP